MSPDGLRIGSVCSGYRGLDMAVETVFGGTTAWVSDIDPGANKILAHHWPTVPNLGDLTTTDWSAVEPVDVFCGGYPCQPFSIAGEKKGTADERHIWPHIARALGVLRPRYAVFENVGNHLRLGFDTVLADLAGLGFDAEWVCVRASDVGAPHPRRRLILLATAQDTDGEPCSERWVTASGEAEAGGGTVRRWRTRWSTCWRTVQWCRCLARVRSRGAALGRRHRTGCPAPNQRSGTSEYDCCRVDDGPARRSRH